MLSQTEMMENIDAHPQGVYVIIVYNKEEFIRHAVFSNFEKAKAWIMQQPNEYTLTAVPFIVDEPDAGFETGVVN